MKVNIALRGPATRKNLGDSLDSVLPISTSLCSNERTKGSKASALPIDVW